MLLWWRFYHNWKAFSHFKTNIKTALKVFLSKNVLLHWVWPEGEPASCSCSSRLISPLAPIGSLVKTQGISNHFPTPPSKDRCIR